MKKKCKQCAYGPCVFESANEDDILALTERCPRGGLADWKTMTAEEPEQEAETGPKWLKVGNFIKIGEGKEVFRIDGYDRDTNTFAVSYTHLIFEKIIKSVNFHIQDFSDVRHVFPKPYTFETAPHMLKVRKKSNGDKDLFLLWISSVDKKITFWSFAEYDNISFEKALRDYEQLDGWPCGTFDEDGEK